MSKSKSTGWSARVEELYNNLGRELWALFYAHCCDRERAYDALQEAFTRLQAQNGHPIHDERAWLLQVGRNWLRDVARRKGTATRTSQHLDEIPAARTDPAAAAAASELQSQVRQALAELKADDREVLVLRYAMGWPSQRIAEVLECAPSAVDMRLSRARRRLGVLLKQIGVDNEQP